MKENTKIEIYSSRNAPDINSGLLWLNIADKKVYANNNGKWDAYADYDDIIGIHTQEIAAKQDAIKPFNNRIATDGTSRDATLILAYLMINPSLKGADLANVYARDLKLSGISFANADLTGTDFNGAELGGCSFINTQASADFTNAVMTNTNFTGARVANSIFTGATGLNADPNISLEGAASLDGDSIIWIDGLEYESGNGQWALAIP